MPTRLLPVLLALAVLGSTSAVAARGIGTGDAARYQNTPGWHGLVQRTALDVVGIPTSAGTFSATDWTLIGGTLAATALLSFPLEGGSLDVRALRRIREWLGPAHLRIWSHSRDVFIYAGIALATGGLFAYGLITKQPAYVESATLMLESFAVSEVFHLVLKLATGRQCIFDGRGLGLYEGPAGSLKHFPCGTPSGHVASIMALVGTLTRFWQSPILDVVLGAIVLFFSATIVADDYHYLSEVLIGAAMGYGIGRWVTDQRSSQYRDTPDGASVVAVRGKPSVWTSSDGSPPTFSFRFPF